MTATDSLIDTEVSVRKRISWRFNSKENVMGFPLVSYSGSLWSLLVYCNTVEINLKTTAIPPKVICFRSQGLTTVLWVLETKMANGGNRTKQRKHSNWTQRTEMSNECEVRAKRGTCERQSSFQTEVTSLTQALSTQWRPLETSNWWSQSGCCLHRKTEIAYI